ncbi:MAG: 4Fe-4S binding protein [Eggerthella lenta]
MHLNHVRSTPDHASTLLLLLGMVLVIALVGKAFCAWMCPAPG